MPIEVFLPGDVCLLKPWTGKRVKCQFCRRRATYISPAISNSRDEILAMCEPCMMAFYVGFNNGRQYTSVSSRPEEDK